MTETDDRMRFDDLLFRLQLELEDCETDDAFRDLGRTMKDRPDHQQHSSAHRLSVALRVLLAFGLLTQDDPFVVREARFKRWCEGFGIDPQACFDEVRRMLQAARQKG